MLKITWRAANAGAPQTEPGVANVNYQSTIDQLVIDGATQSFPRSQGPFNPADPDFAQAFDSWLGNKARIVLMVHGFWYDPTGTDGPSANAPGFPDDPTSTVFGDPRIVDYHNSWLPLVGEFQGDATNRTFQQVADLAIGFAWCSDSDFATFAGAGWSNFYEYAVLDQAPLAARALAFLIDYLAQKNVAIDILAHSLGTRTISQAVGLLGRNTQDRTIGKVVLLDGAEYCVDAFRSFSGRNFQVFNIVNRDDTVLTVGADQMCHPVRWNGSDAARVIGRDGLSATPKWLDIQLDRESAQVWLAKMALPVTPDPDPNDVHPTAWLRHWVCYTNDKNRALVSALLQESDKTIAWFLNENFPAGTDTQYYGHFNSFIPRTPPDIATRTAAVNWSYSDYETYNNL